MAMNLIKKTIMMLLCTALLPSAVFAKEETNNLTGEYNAWKNIAEYIANEYIDDTLTPDEIMEMGVSNLLEGNDEMLVALLKKTLESLDDYSTFYTAEEYKAYTDSLNRTFYGVGIELKKAGQYAEITGFAEENSLAERTGFKIGDRIIKIDGTDVSSKSLDEIRNTLMGSINTTLKITVLRGEEYIDIIATRTEVNEATVIGEILPGNIGYVKIVSFSQNTAEEFYEVQKMFKENGVTRIIMNLRDNPGGLVMSAVKIAQAVVPKGKIVDVQYRQSEYDTVYYSELEETDNMYMVLVNENTASAAEILASAMQDSGVGKLVGTQTFGKAVVQKTYTLNNGSCYKLTSAQYITRNGREINKIGLTPNYEVKNYTEKINVSQYTKMSFSQRYALGSNADTVKGVKERLYMLGIYKGNVDNGVFTEELQEAVKEYQYVNGLSASGVLDIATQVKIENKFSMLQKVVDVQLNKAYSLLGGNPGNLH